MGVAREIAQHFLGATEWPFAVDDPFAVAQRGQIGGKGLRTHINRPNAVNARKHVSAEQSNADDSPLDELVAALSAAKWWIPSVRGRPRRWLLSARRLPEPFPWPWLHRPSTVSDRSQRLESSSPLRSFPCSHRHPPLSGKELATQYSGPKVNSL
jgi:hypothetical protein